jgi:hypothetical protein
MDRTPLAHFLSPYRRQAASQATTCDPKGEDENKLDRGMGAQECRHTEDFGD